MKKFNIFSILRQGKLFLFALSAWLTMQPAWSQDKDYLCFTATKNGTTIQLNPTVSSYHMETDLPVITLQYKIDEGAWETYRVENNNDYSYVVKLSAGQKVYFRAQSTNPAFAKDNVSYRDYSSNQYAGDGITGNYWYFSINEEVECSGNIMSLLNSNCEGSSVPNYAFAGLFKECPLLSAPELPATTLGNYCYFGMFFKCKYLAMAPTLPATTLKDWCYAHMFEGCSKLQYMDVSFKSWHANATKDWAETAYTRKDSHTNYIWTFSSGGLFKCPSSLYKNSTDFNGTSKIPEGWTIEEYNQDYLQFTWNGNYKAANGTTYVPTHLTATILFHETEDLYEENTNVADPDNSPRVKLEYSYNGQNWTEWKYYSNNSAENALKIGYGKSVSIRCGNPEGYSTLSKSTSKYYYFETKFDLGETETVKVGEHRVGRTYNMQNGIDYDRTERNGDRTDAYGNTANKYNYDYKEGGRYYFYTYYKFDYETRTHYLDESEMSQYGGVLGVHGNVMSLLDRSMLKTSVGDYCFYRLFSGPNSKSMQYIYAGPNLPAIDLAKGCYESMFEGCACLQVAPTLPATSTDIEEWDAIDCYKAMFKNCLKLNYIKVGFDKWSTENVTSFTSNWVEGVNTQDGSFICSNDLPKEGGIHRIPQGWLSNAGDVEETEDWLYFSANTDFATIRLDKAGSQAGSLTNLDGKLQYSFDGMHWYNYTWANTSGKVISLNAKAGQSRVYFRNTTTDNSGRCSESTSKYYIFKFSGILEAGGNVMSLLRKDCRRWSVNEFEFINLFLKCSTLKSAPSLPATELKKGCYYCMFKECTSLSVPPALPSEILGEMCYKQMFLKCSSLTYAPELPATTLKSQCYFQMFGNCDALKSAPTLPATVLVDRCYEDMFNSCDSLCYINAYFLDWGGNTKGWVSGVNPTGDFYCPMSSLPQAFNSDSIPLNQNSKWTVHDNSNSFLYFEARRNGSTIQINKFGQPYEVALLYSTDNGNSWHDYTWTGTNGYKITLHKSGTNRVFFKAGRESDTSSAPTRNYRFSKDLKDNVYKFVMKGSFDAKGNIMALLSQDLSLDTVPEYAFGRLFESCSALKSAPTLPATTLNTACYEFMFASCTSLEAAPKLPAKKLSSLCYYGMFRRCINLKQAPELNAMELSDNCYQQMFLNDTCLTIAPTLPAIILKSNCYKEIFSGCKNLHYINVGFKEWHNDATTNWVSDGDNEFNNFGVFMCPKELAENPVYGPNRIPKNDTYKWYVNVAALRFTAENGGATIKLNKKGSPTNVTLQYSLDNAISWNDLVFGEEIYVAKDQNIYIQAKNNVNTFSTSENNYYQFEIGGAMSVSGDVTTLYNTSGNVTSIPDYTFYKLFSGCVGLKNIPTLVRPDIQIGKYSHAYMFENCSAITETPDSLALTLTEGCYKGMFKGCNSILSSPVLPANTLVNNCYEEIFYNCSSLNEITVGFTNWPDNQNYTSNWATNVSKTGIFLCPVTVANKYFGAGGIPYSSSFKWDVNPTYLMFTAVTNATIALNRVGMPDSVMLTYSADLRKWTNYSWNEEQGTQLKLSAGQKLYFKAKDTNATFSQSEDKYYQFAITGEVAVNGYATYLLSRTDRTTTVPAYGFYGLFKDCSTITSAPAPTANTDGNSTINAHAYESMYEGCSSITTIPCELPSMNLGVACYKNMFKGCTNLVATMASLPAPNNIAESCYEGMFEGCENITTAPNIAWTAQPKAATFKAMFKDCKSLVNNLPTQLFINNWGLAESCYESLFEGCESMNSKIDLPAQGFENSCYKALFKDCKSLTSDNMPVIGVSTNGWTGHTSAMESMFEGCESLTYNPIEFDYIFTNINYPIAVMKNMFKGCTNLTEPLPSYISNSTLSESCFEGMYENCTSLTKAPALGQTQLANRCYYRMFAGCTSLKNAPVLPANKDQLKDSCYAYMFNGCEKLRYMDVAFSEWHLDDLGATFMWVENVSAKGTFMCPFELDKQFDESHIPNEWSADDNGNYLCFSKEGSNSLTLSKVGNPTTITVSYSKDKKKSWEHLNVWSPTIYFTDSLYIKISDGALSTSTSDYWYFQSDKELSVSGNIMSLLDATMEETAVPDYAFYKLFSGCPNITDISGLELPATEVGAYAYAKMFEGCSMLKANATSTPELPATTLGAYCYQNLFEGWTALTSAPKLPATTLEQGCYSGMFKGCTSLTTAPVLPATTLVNDCYDSLFDGCKKLNSINVAFTAWVEGATDNWVNDVAYSGDLLCPWSLAQSAKNKWVTGSNYDNAYGGSKIPRDKDHRWIILTHTDMEFNYRTGELSIAGGNPIYWSTDESLAFDNCTTVGTRVDSEPAIVDCNEWLSATTTGLDSITYYALALTGDDDGFTKPTVNSLTIYRHPKKIDMCICDTEEKIETALYYANKVSSANYPIKVFIADGEYNLGNKSIEVGEYVSVIGESLNGTILKSSSDKGALNIKGNDAYLQDMKLVNTGTGAAFTNKGQRTTLHVAMEGYYNEGGMSKHYLPEAWDRATDLTQATVTSASINGSTISLTSDAKYFLVRIDEKYSFASSKDFYIVESLAGKTVTIRAANNRGAFGEPITPNLIEPNGSKSEFSVKLNGYGYSSFCFDDDNIDQLQVIGASVYKGIYRDGAVYLIRLNEHDIVPKRTGVILAGLQNSTVSFYENNSVVLSDEERNPYNYLPDEKCIGMSGNWSTETIVNNGHNYYVLSNNYGGFKPLKKDGGTIKPNKAYFDLGNSTNAATVRIVFGMWEDEEEEVVSGINYLPTTSNDSEYGYTLTGVRTKDAKGLVIQNNKVVLVK